MIRRLTHTIALLLICSLTLVGCRGEYEILPVVSNELNIPHEDYKDLRGFYLLNEGNMGSNKATLDYCDLSTGVYHRNVYAEANPHMVKELGDVGNDIGIFGSKLYAVINVSNFIEVMDARTARHIGMIKIPNVRYIIFNEANGKAYASSYVAPVKFDQNARVGYVAEIDTTTLEVTRTCNVGYQPEEMVIWYDRKENRQKLYVANSGGYMFPNYDHTISVIDLNTFTQERKIDVDINLHRLRKGKLSEDSNGPQELIVTSRGDYYDHPSRLFFIDLKTDQVIDTLSKAVTNLYIDYETDKAYFYAVDWSYNTQQNTITYGTFDIRTHELTSTNFIKDHTEEDIRIPYGIAVNPINNDIYITDALDYVTPGDLRCYGKDGYLKWKTDTGDIPGHFAFLYHK